MGIDLQHCVYQSELSNCTYNFYINMFDSPHVENENALDTVRQHLMNEVYIIIPYRCW